MNGLREVCANRECRHDRTSHHARTTLRPPRGGGPFDVVAKVHGTCLQPFCKCLRYEAEKR